jgi:hypothetical protein
VSSLPGHEPDPRVERAEKARRTAGPGHDAVPTDALAEFEDREEAKRVERMAEVQIVARLQATGFDPVSRDWKAFAAALVEYGYAVLVAWGVTGELAVRVAVHGGVSKARVPANLRLNEDDARGLAADVLMVSIDKFRAKSLTQWSPDGGASLKTFFIGRCLLELADVYQRWYRLERRRPPLDPRVDDGRFGCRPDVQAEARVITDQLLGDEEAKLRRILERQGDGYEIAEIAEELGTTPASVRSTLYRGRHRIAGEVVI